jgi:hypothetical protein
MHQKADPAFENSAALERAFRGASAATATGGAAWRRLPRARENAAPAIAAEGNGR